MELAKITVQPMLPKVPDEVLTDWIAQEASRRAFRCFSVLSDLIEEFTEEQAKCFLAALVTDPALAGTLLRDKLVGMVVERGVS
jgi:hypothetical protein